MVVGARRRVVRWLAQRKGRQDRRLNQRPRLPCRRVAAAKDLVARAVYTLPQALEVALEHQLVQVRHGPGVLRDLLAGLGVQDRQAGVHMPLLAVDAQHDVHLDVFNAADVPAEFPWELTVGVPCLAHG